MDNLGGKMTVMAMTCTLFKASVLEDNDNRKTLTPIGHPNLSAVYKQTMLISSS